MLCALYIGRIVAMGNRENRVVDVGIQGIAVARSLIVVAVSFNIIE